MADVTDLAAMRRLELGMTRPQPAAEPVQFQQADTVAITLCNLMHARHTCCFMLPWKMQNPLQQASLGLQHAVEINRQQQGAGVNITSRT